MTFLTRYLLIIAIYFLYSCNSNQKFDKTKWHNQGELRTFPYRRGMIDDLITNHKFIGLTYKRLIDSLGEPETDVNDRGKFLYYNIITDYGGDIDPVYSKTLKFHLNKDSVVTSYKVEEWRKK